MSLADEITKRKAQERADAARRANPELEAKLDRFIAENPQLLEHYNAMSKEELIRKLMFAKMERTKAIAVRNRELEPWVREHPEIVDRVEQRIGTAVKERRIVPNVEQSETAARPVGPRIRP